MWEKVLDAIVEKLRVERRKNPTPGYGLIDSQSVKTVYASEERGIDGEKIRGRKRHIVADTLGNILSVTVHAANIHDTKAGIEPAEKPAEKYPALKGFCADAGYRKSFEEAVKERPDLRVDISEKIKPHEWEKLPWRWVVERTFSWLGHSRRLAKDFEIAVQSVETIICISHLHTLT